MHTKLNRNIIALIIFFLTAQTSFPVQPDTIWTKTFGGTNIDVAYSVKQTDEGGYIIAGYTRSFGTLSGRNIWLIKTDSAGNQVWNNTYGGNSDDEAYDVQQTSDGHFILTGYTKSSGAGLSDVILVKADSLGNQIWKKTFGGTSDEEGYGIIESSDGGYVIAGATSSFGAGSRDVWLIKTDTSGNEIWKKTFGGLSSDGARSLYMTTDGGFIITGWTYSQGPGIIGNAWLIKTNSAGVEEWNKYFGGADADRGLSVQQTSDEGFILTGYTASSGAGLDDLLLIKTNNQGIEQWYKTFGGTGRDYGNCVSQTSEGGYIAAGYTLSFGAGGDDLWILKTDSAGIGEWSQTFGGSYSDVGYSIQQTSDAGFIVTGHTLSFGAGVHDVWLIKLAPVIPVELISFSGNRVHRNIELSWKTASELNNRGFEIERKLSHESKWNKIGFVEGNGTVTKVTDYFFIDTHTGTETLQYRLKQIDFNGSYKYLPVIEISNNIEMGFSLKQNYPNPFNPSTTISYSIPQKSFVLLKIYDILGGEVRILVNEEQSAGHYNIDWNAEYMNAGVYYYTITVGQHSETRKMILLK